MDGVCEMRQSFWKKVLAAWLSFLLIFMASLVPGLDGTAAEGAVTVSAPSAILLEAQTGTVIFEKDADRICSPASITKIMTLLLIFEALGQGQIHLTDEVVTSEHAQSMGGSQVFLEAGEVQTVETLIKCIAVASGNDAAVAMAEYVCGSEEAFVAKMNEKAAELGMDSTHFVTCTGLHDENHYTTVRDLTKLLSYALQNDTFRQIYCTSEYTTSATASAPEGLHFLSTMFKKMDSPAVNGGEIEGGKTGYTSEAGQCLASLAKVDDVEYILVTAGAPGGPSTEPYHIEDAKTVYNRIQAGEQGSVADTAADSQDDQATTETDEAA